MHNQRVIGLTSAVVLATVLATIVVLDGPVRSLVRDTSSPSVGTVKAVGVGVYWDNACSSRVVSIDWGLVEPGSVENVTVFIKNEGNVAATLSLEMINWSPANASNFITLSWSYGGQAIVPNEVVEVALFLSVSPSIEGISTFSLDIVITGNG